MVDFPLPSAKCNLLGATLKHGARRRRRAFPRRLPLRSRSCPGDRFGHRAGSGRAGIVGRVEPWTLLAEGHRAPRAPPARGPAPAAIARWPPSPPTGRSAQPCARDPMVVEGTVRPMSPHFPWQAAQEAGQHNAPICRTAEIFTPASGCEPATATSHSSKYASTDATAAGSCVSASSIPTAEAQGVEAVAAERSADPPIWA